MEKSRLAGIEACPLPEQSDLSAGLDYYKLTMSQLAYEREPNAVVTYDFHNRGSDHLLDYVDPDKLKARFELLRENGFSAAELEYIGGLTFSNGNKIFTPGYIDYIASNKLPEPLVDAGEKSADLAIRVIGPWALATFWETVVMSEVNEAYFEGYMRQNGLHPEDVYAEGDRRLSAKIDILRQRPDIKFADFGTRRRFSLRWQKHVLERLNRECPANLTGTSNIEFSREYGTKPVGTFAHEMPMVYAALAQARGLDVRSSQGHFLDDWHERYGIDYAVALTDTFGSDFFFSDTTRSQAARLKGLRNDSGDPMLYGEKAIKWYSDFGLDPKERSIVFSNALDIHDMVHIQDHFHGRIATPYGWGTKLTNDTGIDALNIVMKGTYAYDPLLGRGARTVKISDDPEKHTGNEEEIDELRNGVFAPTKLIVP